MKPIVLVLLTLGFFTGSTFVAARWSSSHSEAAAPFQSNVTSENDTNRPGSDYRDFAVQADPAQCRDACANDATCKAFTYVKPGIQGANAHCWLKSAVPNASSDGCCVSGVKSGGNSNTGLEVDTNRLGGDFRDFELRSNNPNECRDACVGDGRCQSFTYVRPSYFGQYSHCFLKDSVPSASQNGCCISGVVRSNGGGGGEVKDIDWGYRSANERRGRNGERFRYCCPAGAPISSTWGTDIYTDDSSICTAATHAGAISASSGGVVTIEIRPGLQSYRGSTRNGVTTGDYGGWYGSFVIVR